MSLTNNKLVQRELEEKQFLTVAEQRQNAIDQINKNFKLLKSLGIELIFANDATAEGELVRLETDLIKII